jgi:hypothetical protein
MPFKLVNHWFKHMGMERDPSYGPTPFSLHTVGVKPRILFERDESLPEWHYTPYPPMYATPPHILSLILIRGLIGSGKSEVARSFGETHWHFEADQHFLTHDGWFFMSPYDIPEVHEWCETQTAEALYNVESVVVSNTFCTNEELAPYLLMAEAAEAEVLLIDLLPPENPVGHRLPRGVNRGRFHRQWRRWEWFDLDIVPWKMAVNHCCIEPPLPREPLKYLPYICQPGTCTVGDVSAGYFASTSPPAQIPAKLQ